MNWEMDITGINTHAFGLTSGIAKTKQTGERTDKVNKGTTITFRVDKITLSIVIRCEGGSSLTLELSAFEKSRYNK